MDRQIVAATPTLCAQFRARSGTNAVDFVRYEDNYYSGFAIHKHEPIALIVAKYRCLAEPMQIVSEAFIDIIEVLPEYRRQGIATMLVEAVLQWAKMRRAQQVRAWSEEIRHEALMLWNKLGFTFSRVDFQNGDEKRYGFYVAKRLLQ